MRKSTQHTLTFGLLLSAIGAMLTAAVIALGILLSDAVPVEVAGVITVVLLLALALVFPFSVIAYFRRSSHRSWKVNLARYPALKPAIELYREKGESAWRLLPALLVDGRRYFLVKYGRKNLQWAPDEHETGMVVLDEHGRVQDDERLFESLLRSVRYVEDSYIGLRGQEDIMAVGGRMEREAAEARHFFSRVVRSAGRPELMEDIDAFLTEMASHAQRWAALIESEYHWCRKNRKRVGFTLEETKPLEKARKETSLWDIETAGKIARAWAKVAGQRGRLESLPGLSGYDRARLRKLLDALGVAAKAASDVEKSNMQIASERIEAYRSRTASALQLEGQAQPSASAT